MVHSCCVKGCKEIAIKGCGVTFHSFPKNEERRSLWVSKLGRENFKVTNNTKICSRHFTPDSFDREKFGATWLKNTAVPTLFDLPPTNQRPRPKGRPKKRTIEDIETSSDGVFCTKLSSSSSSSFCMARQPSVSQCLPLMVSPGCPLGDLGPPVQLVYNERISPSQPRFTSSSCSGGKRKFFIGDFDDEDMASPTKACHVLHMAKNSSQSYRQIVNRLRAKNRRLERKISFMQKILTAMRNNALKSQSAWEVIGEVIMTKNPSCSSEENEEGYV